MIVGFIGLGRMGLPMARNLAKAGHDVRAFDTSEAARDAARAAGLALVAEAEAAADGVATLITMLPTGRETLAVYEGTTVLAAAAKGTLFIDCSSIDVASAKRAHGRAGTAGMASLDAPVSGGIGGAEAGTLTFMVGGTAEAFAAARPVLEAMGKKIIHCGAAGAGQAVKMCNQMMVAANVAVVAEAFVLAERLGIDPKVLYDVVVGSSGNSWALEKYAPVPGLAPMSAADRGFTPGFTTALMLKDLKIFQDAARAEASASPVGASAMQLYQLMHDAGYDAHDYSAVIDFLRGRKAGIPGN
ncbi:MAG: 3-hydroxyisobutyrate dehydrogenase [Hyphomicrobiaceae bacterium]